MPRVIFWNIARSGGGWTDAGVGICEDLAGLAERVQREGGGPPDAFVLCECNKGFTDHPELLPSEYKFFPQREAGTSYRGPNQLRYALIGRKGSQCDGFLLKTHSGSQDQSFRPALGVVTKNNATFIALHAASITRSQTKQIGQIKTAFDEFRAQAQGQTTRGPDVILGDFNINLLSTPKSEIKRRLADHAELAGYEPRCSRRGTHRGNGWRSKLDWALVSPSARAKVRVITAQDVVQNSGGLLKLGYEGVKNSDHRPIMVDW